MPYILTTLIVLLMHHCLVFYFKTAMYVVLRVMKDNKSPGVHGIPPKLLLEIIEEISIRLATVFILSLEEGIVPIEWKEANIIQLFKDHLVDFLIKNNLINSYQHGFLKARTCLTNMYCFWKMSQSG